MGKIFQYRQMCYYRNICTIMYWYHTSTGVQYVVLSQVGLGKASRPRAVEKA